MTERKPAGASWRSWIDRQIEEAQKRGEFDDLPGYGKPIPDIDQPHDDMWWVRKKLRSEGASFLPPTLAIRKDVEDSVARAHAARTEEEVRTIVEGLNQRIRQVNRTTVAGPPSTTVPLDVDTVVRDWRSKRNPPRAADG